MSKRIAVLLVVSVLSIAAQVWGSEIHDAIVAGDLERVRGLLESDPKLVNDRDTAQSLPLHLAANRGHLAIVELLLARGADINTGDREDSSPLVNAAMGNRMDVVRLLVERGADVTARDDNGVTALISAARQRNLAMVRFLVDHGAQITDTSALGSNCLIIAASVGADSLVDYLLTRGFDINKRNRSGFDALYYASMNNYPGIAATLIEHGADLQYRSDHGETRMYTAAVRGDTAIAAMLLARGLDVNGTDNWGMTPLTAAAWGNHEMAKWLVAHGASVEPTNDSVPAPISTAVFSGNVETVRLLVNAGANVNHRARQGESPLHAAVMQGADEIAAVLIEGGAEVNATDRNYGRTLLHKAAIKGDSSMVKLLLDHGAGVDAADQDGKPPLHYAIHYANPGVASALKARGASLPDEAASRPTEMLAEGLGDKEAVVWYLGHSAWAIKTVNHYLVFDYNTPLSVPDRPCLANGRIDPAQIKDLPVTVFCSHEHGDHYDTSIFAWRDVIPNITYVMGHQPRIAEEYTYTAPRTDQMIDGMRVRTIRATDAGVGFLVEVDGLVIFHAGDHSNGRAGDHSPNQTGLHAPYTDEIDYIASLGRPIDFAFLPITGCSLGTPESVREGNIYALKTLAPVVFFPQHAMNNEHQFRALPELLKEHGLTVQLACPENGGDCFRYRDHQVL